MDIIWCHDHFKQFRYDSLGYDIGYDIGYDMCVVTLPKGMI